MACPQRQRESSPPKKKIKLGPFYRCAAMDPNNPGMTCERMQELMLLQWKEDVKKDKTLPKPTSWTYIVPDRRQCAGCGALLFPSEIQQNGMGMSRYCYGVGDMEKRLLDTWHFRRLNP